MTLSGTLLFLGLACSDSKKDESKKEETTKTATDVATAKEGAKDSPEAKARSLLSQRKKTFLHRKMWLHLPPMPKRPSDAMMMASNVAMFRMMPRRLSARY